MAVLPSELGAYRSPLRTRARAGAVRALLVHLRQLAPSWRDTPFVCTYLTVLAFGTAVLSTLDAHTQIAVLRNSSTDIAHLTTHPIFVLVTSGLWVDGVSDYLAAALALAVVGGWLERRIGSRRVLGVFVSGHVGATLVTEGAVAVGIHAGMLPTSSASRLDVGVSYGLAALLAAAAGAAARRRIRLVGVLGAWAYLGWPLADGLDMTSWGHVVALAIGVAWWPMLVRFRAGPTGRHTRQAVAQPAADLGMMVRWRRWTASRWRAACSSPRPRSTTRTSAAPSSSCSTTTPAARSASS